MKGVMAMVLAGGRVHELGLMTEKRPKAAVPFGGQYRVIDFVMSNLMLSGVHQVGILSQYRPAMLIEHVGAGEPWDLYGRGRRAEILAPYQGNERWDLYRGTADAVYQNLHFVTAAKCEHVLVLSGDHIYHDDYHTLFAAHAAADVDVTALFLRVPGQKGHPSRFGVAEVADPGDDRAGGRPILRYVEKPAVAASDLASMTVYLFRADALIRHLTENARDGVTHQLYDEVIPAMVAEGRAQAVVYDGYWAYARTLPDYHRAHMDLVDGRLPLDTWTVRTNEETLGLGTAPPAQIGESAVVTASRLAPGVHVLGHVNRSVLFPGVVVEAGAEVRDSVLLNGCHVGAGARLHGVIGDEGAQFGAGAHVGGGGDGDGSDAVTLVAAGARVPAGSVVGAGSVVPVADRAV